MKLLGQNSIHFGLGLQNVTLHVLNIISLKILNNGQLIHCQISKKKKIGFSQF